ncbi:uncharacterized protein [Watersipora subatra]|uniref:uncharacterized protein n=1 Tax=Watersipora subatra TaxID=2589382 RepID=UPI00355BC126
MHPYPNAPMSECTHIPMHPCPNAPISQCTYVQMHPYPNAPMSQCTHIPMHTCPNALISNNWNETKECRVGPDSGSAMRAKIESGREDPRAGWPDPGTSDPEGQDRTSHSGVMLKWFWERIRGESGKKASGESGPSSSQDEGPSSSSTRALSDSSYSLQLEDSPLSPSNTTSYSPDEESGPSNSQDEGPSSSSARDLSDSSYSSQLEDSPLSPSNTTTYSVDQCCPTFSEHGPDLKKNDASGPDSHF